MLTVGLTGGMGAGKSTVAAMLASRGAVVIDADRIARQVVAPGQPAYRAIVERFGGAVVQPDGRLDRGAIASVVFSEPDALGALNAITHPVIIEMIGCRLAEERPTAHVVVLDVPLLSEPLRSACDLAGVIVVDVAEEVAIERLVEQRGLTEADAWARMAAQPSRDERCRGADLVLDNSGSITDLEAAVERAWQWIGFLGGAG